MWWDELPKDIKSDYFNHLGPCYDNEKKLYDKFVCEAFNQNGIKCMYYPVDFNTSYDRIFGEDNDRMVMRRFMFMAYYDLPDQNRQYTQFGIDEIDTFQMHVSKGHFHTASQQDVNADPYDGNEYEPYVPKEGDIIESLYNETFYEVLHVNDTEEQFLQSKHAWVFTVRVYRDTHMSLNPDTSASMENLQQVVDVPDILEINDTAQNERDVNTSGLDNLLGGW